MRLTIEQVQRLCGVERLLCQTVLDSLVDGKFLCVKSDGAYARFTDAEVRRAYLSATDLRTAQSR
jgi:hypothetical protein